MKSTKYNEEYKDEYVFFNLLRIKKKNISATDDVSKQEEGYIESPSKCYGGAG